MFKWVYNIYKKIRDFDLAIWIENKATNNQKR